MTLVDQGPEFRPLCFVSEGPNKGKPEHFPDPTVSGSERIGKKKKSVRSNAASSAASDATSRGLPGPIHQGQLYLQQRSLQLQHGQPQSLQLQHGRPHLGHKTSLLGVMPPPSLGSIIGRPLIASTQSSSMQQQQQLHKIQQLQQSQMLQMQQQRPILMRGQFHPGTLQQMQHKYPPGMPY